MIIDSLTDKDAINISALTVPEPLKQPNFFDADREVKPEDWAGIKTSADIFYRNGSLSDYTDTLCRARIISPQKIPFDQEDAILFKFLQSNFNDWSIVGNWNWTLDEALTIKRLFPNKFNLVEDELAKVKVMILHAIESSSTKVEHDQVYLMANWKCLFPGEKFPFEPDDEFWRQNWAAYAADQSKVTMTAEATWFAEWAKRAKIIKPDLVYPPKMLTKMIYFLDRFRKDQRWMLFAQLAANLKILTAEKIYFSDQGMELFMPSQGLDTTEKIPEMPVKRIF